MLSGINSIKQETIKGNKFFLFCRKSDLLVYNEKAEIYGSYYNEESFIKEYEKQGEILNLGK
jgi:hypothetical protein